MDEREWLAERFEEQRAHLKAVAYRMLGSLTEADDAVQDAWLRLNHSGANGIDNLRAWMTTVVARICLNVLRSRKARREEPLDIHIPDPVISLEDRVDPEQQILLADSVGLALQVVLDTLAPDERLAFVLHDMFDMPFHEIASIVGCSPEAARQMASRARRRVRGSAPVPDAEITAQRWVVEAFIAAARGGDINALVAVLDPEVVLRSDAGVSQPGATGVMRGAAAVARMALGGARDRPSLVMRPVLINGAAGVILLEGVKPLAVWGFTIARGKIVEIDSISDPERLRGLGIGPGGSVVSSAPRTPRLRRC
jgi:RNA polymerase sigma factor (sigma-70 family)